MLRTLNNKACLQLPLPSIAALISIQSECWERRQWWGQCRWMGSTLRTAWQHALYVSLHTVGNLLRWKVKWRWMPIVDLPDWLLENTKHGPRQWRSASFYLLKRQSKSLTPGILSLSLLLWAEWPALITLKKKKRKKYNFVLSSLAIIRIHFSSTDKTTY